VLTCHKKAVTELRNFLVSIFPERLIESTVTCNIAKEKQAIDQRSRSSSLGGTEGSRSWCVIPQAAATESRLSDKRREIGQA